jgi:hypothetical protein
VALLDAARRDDRSAAGALLRAQACLRMFERVLTLERVASLLAVPAGGRPVWSCVFPLPPGKEVPPEAFLQPPLRQGFKPQLFLDGKVVVLTLRASVRHT